MGSYGLGLTAPTVAVRVCRSTPGGDDEATSQAKARRYVTPLILGRCATQGSSMYIMGGFYDTLIKW